MIARLSRNSFWLTLGRLGTQIGLALFTILLARQLGSQAFGAYAFISSVVLIGNVITTFGTDMYLIRELAASEDISLLNPALVLQLLLSALFIGLVFLVSGLLRAMPLDTTVAMRIYSLSLLPMAFFTVYTIALRAQQRMLAYSVLSLALIALQVAAILVLIWLHGGLVSLAWLLLFVQILSTLVAARLARPVQLHLELVHSLTTAFRPVLQLMQASAPIAVLAIVGIIYQRLSLLVLPWLAGSAVTGWFSAAARVVEASKLAHVAAFTAIYPMMAQARSVTSSDFSRTFRLPWWLLLGAATLASLVISAFAAPLAGLLYGPEYAASIPVLRILAWDLVPYSISGFLTLAFLARGQTDSILRALGAATLALAALMLWLFPILGAPGVAAAVIAGETVQAVVLALQFGRFGRPRYTRKTLHGSLGTALLSP